MLLYCSKVIRFGAGRLAGDRVQEESAKEDPEWVRSLQFVSAVVCVVQVRNKAGHAHVVDEATVPQGPAWPHYDKVGAVHEHEARAAEKNKPGPRRPLQVVHLVVAADECVESASEQLV